MKDLKNKNAITLLALIITVIVLLILATVSISLIINSGILDHAQQGVDRYSEEEELEQIKLAIASARLKGNGFLTTENLNSELKDRFGEYKEANPIDDYWNFSGYKISNNGQVEKNNELFFSKNFLEKGEVVVSNGASVNYINVTVDNKEYPGISITGRPNRLWYDEDRSSCIRWHKNIDLSYYNSLEFMAKKGADHGIICIKIDGENVLSKNYRDLSSDWVKYSIDISEYEDFHEISFYGGYWDNTGYAKSNTQYCKICLKK